MSDETPQLGPEDPEIPSERPEPGAADPEIEGPPMGTDPEEDVDPAAQPGIPTEGEPPASE